jgi:uncharacterized protein YdeI (YjbR/CyaY-like superfamily)
MIDERANPVVDEYLRTAPRWREEMEKLREILFSCGLTEDLKWGKPCYLFQDGIVAIVIAFKEYCALSFFKGTLLKDPQGILVKPGENSQASRQIRFNSLSDILSMEELVKAYVLEAIEVEKAGLKVEFKESAELVLPEELIAKFDEIPALKTAFEALTPGRQRAYVLHFSGAKQSKTRVSRIEKYIPQILAGKGLDD